MIVTEVRPATLDRQDVATEAGRAWLTDRYARSEQAYVRLNMITSLTGAASGSDGTSDTLTSRTDRTILGVIRAAADVVVVGAQSVRAEGYIVPRSTRLAIVTASGDLEGHRLTLAEGASPDRVLIVCPESRADAIRADAVSHGVQIVAVPGDERMSPPAILAALAERGLRRVVCEGGPSLASQFAAAGVIDEYCITVAPTIEPVAQPFLRLDVRPDTDPVGVLVDEAGFSYLRLRARR